MFNRFSHYLAEIFTSWVFLYNSGLKYININNKIKYICEVLKHELRLFDILLMKSCTLDNWREKLKLQFEPRSLFKNSRIYHRADTLDNICRHQLFNLFFEMPFRIDQTPDYEYLKNLFKNRYKKRNYGNRVFDWNLSVPIVDVVKDGDIVKRKRM